MSNFSVETAAYAAGFFDGEGCVHVGRYARKITPASRGELGWIFRVILTNTNRDVLVWFGSVFGGRIHTKSRGKKNWKLGYNLTIYGQDAARFLRAIAPYVRLKKIDVEIGLTFAATLKDRAKNEYLSADEKWLREQLIKTSHEAHKRGVTEEIHGESYRL